MSEMTCNHCGAGVNGSIAEMIAWSDLHEYECPGPKAKK